MKEKRALLFFISFIFFILLSIYGFKAEVKSHGEHEEIEETHCDLASRMMKFYGGQLSDYWAQEYIGSDLAREEILDQYIKENPLPENLVTVIDSPPNDVLIHGLSVLNLISHSGKQAILPFSPSVKNHWIDINTSSQLSLRNMLVIKNILDGQKPYSFVNTSFAWRSFKEYFSARGLSDRGTILIKSLGNNFPNNMSLFESEALRHLNVIGVGSLSPFGTISSSSAEAEDKSFSVILAPSDKKLLTKDANGENFIFNGKSGAAPLVTGTLAAFEWIVGRRQTLEELRIILKRTFIPSIISHQKPPRNGVGVLNTYKIIKTAEKISSHCQNESDEEERKRCIKDGIENSNTYEFQEFSNSKLKNTVEKYFPRCLELVEGFYSMGNSLKDELVETSTVFAKNICQEKKDALKTLRKEALLNPENKHLWNTLSCIYKMENYDVNSIYYKLTGLSAEPRDSFLTHEDEIISMLDKAREESELKSYDPLKDRFRVRSLFFKDRFRIRFLFFSDNKLFSFLQRELELWNLFQPMTSQLKDVFGLAKFLRRKEDRFHFYNESFSYKDDLIESALEGKENKSLCTLVNEINKEAEKDDMSVFKYPSLIRRSVLENFYFSEEEDEEISNLLIERLKDPDVKVRMMALNRFSVLQNDELKIEVLNCAIPNQNVSDDLIKNLIYILNSLKSELQKKEFLEKVIEGKDYSPLVKASMMMSLQVLESKEVKKELLSQAFEQGDKYLKTAVMASLWVLEDNNEIKQFIENGYNDLDLRCEALLSIGHLNNDEDKINFIDRALSEEEHVCVFDDRRALPDLSPLSTRELDLDKALNIRTLAMKVLWTLSDENEIVNYLDLGFKALEPETRKQAIEQAIYLDNKDEKKKFISQAFRDKSADVRKNIVKHVVSLVITSDLNFFHPTTILADLSNASKDTDSEVRLQVVQSLIEFNLFNFTNPFVNFERSSRGSEFYQEIQSYFLEILEQMLVMDIDPKVRIHIIQEIDNNHLLWADEMNQKLVGLLKKALQDDESEVVKRQAQLAIDNLLSIYARRRVFMKGL